MAAHLIPPSFVEENGVTTFLKMWVIVQKIATPTYKIKNKHGLLRI